MSGHEFRVFLALRPIRGGRWIAEWVVRGTGGTLYKSKPCATEAGALALARRYLAKRPDMLDTTPADRFPVAP